MGIISSSIYFWWYNFKGGNDEFIGWSSGGDKFAPYFTITNLLMYFFFANWRRRICCCAPCFRNREKPVMLVPRLTRQLLVHSTDTEEVLLHRADTEDGVRCFMNS